MHDGNLVNNLALLKFVFLFTSPDTADGEALFKTKFQKISFSEILNIFLTKNNK